MSGWRLVLYTTRSAVVKNVNRNSTTPSKAITAIAAG